MENVRLHFVKINNAKYLSHLDTYRAIMRAIGRTDLNVWFTEGFNSHMFISFPLPLSLGMESTCEVADIKLLYPTDYVAERINAFLPEGIEVFNTTTPKMKTAQIVYAKYIIELDDLSVSQKDLAEKLRTFMSKDEIMLKKTGKKGKETVFNAKDKIKDYYIDGSGKKLMMVIVCDAGPTSNLNPAAVIEAFSEDIGREIDHISVRRIKILTADMKEFE